MLHSNETDRRECHLVTVIADIKVVFRQATIILV